MNVSELLKWQWEGYLKYHQSRTNLLIHIVIVPFFLIGNLITIAGILGLSWVFMISGLLLMLLSIILQAKGHGVESNPPEPFTSAANAVARIFLEQWVTFPRFVLTGQWFRAFRQAGQIPGQ
ncbi:Mpo1-like protein [Gynuella sunshinyii]|uniref:Phage terminase, small subunit n=1 Tax=Gynuella sunshinyii YC6258 TaxID=1445510 RepID=A0A0C5VLG7_9GAMM|nr:Mpo1-like protein [Gynuella sunshinyii]AJQ95141.1 hypothetical Protein YC6258_03105 [Gynuella sunshinyii YC6258]